MPFDKPIIIEQMNEESEEWSKYMTAHASINKTRQSEYLSAGASQSKRTLTFEVRYSRKLEAIANSTQTFRIVHKGQRYNIVDYDDYQLKHQTVKLVGESY